MQDTQSLLMEFLIKTRKQLAKFFKDTSYQFDGVISEQTLEDIISLKKFYRPIPWTFHEEFESIKWYRYDESHAPRNLGRIGHIKIEKENNGNSYVSLTSQLVSCLSLTKDKTDSKG